MLTEIRGVKPDLNVEMLGVNRTSDASANVLAIRDRKLPWLQDTLQDNVWSKWGVTYRDVRIIGPQGNLLATYNLTAQDLGIAANFTALKQMFLNTARAVDSDGDHLLDDWEMLYFGHLSSQGAADSDNDGFNNFTEFAGGASPVDPLSQPAVTATKVLRQEDLLAGLSFRRRAGFWLDYLIDESHGLTRWLENTANLSGQQQFRTLFDGSGCAEVTYTIPASEPESFFRVRATPRR